MTYPKAPRPGFMAGQLKANHETWGSTVVELHTKAPKEISEYMV